MIRYEKESLLIGGEWDKYNGEIVISRLTLDNKEDFLGALLHELVELVLPALLGAYGVRPTHVDYRNNVLALSRKFDPQYMFICRFPQNNLKLLEEVKDGHTVPHTIARIKAPPIYPHQLSMREILK